MTINAAARQFEITEVGETIKDGGWVPYRNQWTEVFGLGLADRLEQVAAAVGNKAARADYQNMGIEVAVKATAFRIDLDADLLELAARLKGTVLVEEEPTPAEPAQPAVMTLRDLADAAAGLPPHVLDMPLLVPDEDGESRHAIRLVTPVDGYEAPTIFWGAKYNPT